MRANERDAACDVAVDWFVWFCTECNMSSSELGRARSPNTTSRIEIEVVEDIAELPVVVD